MQPVDISVSKLECIEITSLIIVYKNVSEPVESPAKVPNVPKKTKREVRDTRTKSDATMKVKIGNPPPSSNTTLFSPLTLNTRFL